MRTEPLYAQVRDNLRAEIRRGAYSSGGSIQSEAALGERFGVSRITVRHALGELQREGLIYKVNGRGAFVDRPKVPQGLGRLEGFGEAMSRLGFESTNRVLRMCTALAPVPVAKALGIAPDRPVTEINWVRDLDGVPFCYERSWLPCDMGELLSREKLARRDLFAILEQDHGIRLGDAELSIEAVLANPTHARWLDIQPGRPCLRIERLTRLASRRPINMDYLFFRGDAFQYKLSISRKYPDGGPTSSVRTA